MVVIQDDRVRRQVEQFVQQLGFEDLRLATFKNHQEFTALYYRDPAKTAPSEGAEGDPAPEGTENPRVTEAKPEDEGDLKLFSEVHMLIFALDSIGEKSGPWIEKMKLNMKRFKHWPEQGPMRLVMLKYEDDGVNKLDILHPLLDDLIFLPLDRLVFLQKLEILMNLPARVKPRFLFTQEVKQDIEISKITKLDRLSDVGLAIRNPIPLKKGLPGHFYVQLPNEKTRLEIHGKVFRSEPHPEYPGQFLVYFSYFGLPKGDLSMIRRSLAKAPRYQSLYNDDRNLFRYNNNASFGFEPQKSFGIAVVDPDAGAAQNLAIQVGKDVDQVKAIAESSYSLFLHTYFDPSGKGDKTFPKPTEATDLYATPFTLTVNANDFKCVGVNPVPEEKAEFLGHRALDVFSTPDRYLSLITHKGTRLVLEESILFAAKDRKLDKLLIIQDANGNSRALNMHLYHGDADHLVNINITPASSSDILSKLGSQEQTQELHAMIVDSAYVPDDIQPWVDGLRARGKQIGLTKEDQVLKFFVIAENDSRARERWLASPDVLGYFLKPVDTRQLGFLLSEYLPNKNTVYQFENLGWAQPGIAMHVSKDVQLESLSEFGATLKTKQIMAPGTIIYLRKSIYDNAPNQCLAARVYACEPHPSDKDHYSVYTTYFGIGDQFLKFARTYIRENYAVQKSKEG